MNKQELFEKIIAYAKQKNIQLPLPQDLEDVEKRWEKKAMEIGEQFDQLLVEKKQIEKDTKKSWFQDFKNKLSDLFLILSPQFGTKDDKDDKALFAWPVGQIPENAMIEHIEVDCAGDPEMVVLNIVDKKEIPTKKSFKENWIFKFEKSLPMGEYEICVTSGGEKTFFDLLVAEEAAEEASAQKLMGELRFLELIYDDPELQEPEKQRMFKKAAFQHMSRN